jgi:hypothetical protein
MTDAGTEVCDFPRAAATHSHEDNSLRNFGRGDAGGRRANGFRAKLDEQPAQDAPSFRHNA